MMKLGLRRGLLVLSAVLSGAFSLGSTCDPFPDECEEGTPGACEGNVARNCVRPVPEVRSRDEREDCGAARTCMRDVKGHAVCARKEGPDCEEPGKYGCNGDQLGVCTDIEGGRKVWVDQPCFNNTPNWACVERAGGANCEQR